MSYLIVRSILALILLSQTGSVALATNPAQLNQVKDEIDRGHFQQSINLLTAYITKNSKDAEAYVLRGSCYRHLCRYEKAINDYSLALKLSPSSADIYHRRAIAYCYAGQMQKVIADETKAISIDKSDADSLYDRGLAYQHLNNLDLAIADYSEAIKLKPDYHDAFINRSAAFAGIGKYHEALSDCDAAIKIGTDRETDYSNRYSLDWSLGNYQQAVSDATLAIELHGSARLPNDDVPIPQDPELGQLYYYRGHAYFKLNEYDKANLDCWSGKYLGVFSADSDGYGSERAPGYTKGLPDYVRVLFKARSKKSETSVL
jgi:tetratricopeptide (TPR) repeat protein